MAKSETSTLLDPGASVILKSDLREAPAGTAGKIELAVGLSWKRYWVKFSNGQSVGSVNRSVLATPDEWRKFLEVGDEPGSAEASGEVGEEAGGETDSGGGHMHDGILVPQLLLDRSKAARERLGA